MLTLVERLLLQHHCLNQDTVRVSDSTIKNLYKIEHVDGDLNIVITKTSNNLVKNIAFDDITYIEINGKLL